MIKLHQEDYEGKRLYVKITDDYDNVISIKLDIGVHTLFDLE